MYNKYKKAKNEKPSFIASLNTENGERIFNKLF